MTGKRVDRRLQRVAIPGWGGHGQGNSTASLARISMLQHSLRAVRSGAWQYLDLARSQWCSKSHCEVWVVRGSAALVAGGLDDRQVEAIQGPGEAEAGCRYRRGTLAGNPAGRERGGGLCPQSQDRRGADRGRSYAAGRVTTGRANSRTDAGQRSRCAAVSVL